MKFLYCVLVLVSFRTLFAQEEEESRKEDIEARNRYRVQMRADQNGKIPFNALLDAKRELDARRLLRKESKPKTMDAGLGAWEWLGPGNIGGRIRSILILPTAPNTMWIGSASGGIWRTDNAGDSWYPLTDFLANLEITSIVNDPTNILTMYASTGEGFSGAGEPPGAGIFKSMDAGLTWNQLPSTANPDFAYANRLAHHPSVSNILLAATQNGVYRTTDGGSTWLRKLTGNSLQVKYHPTDPNRVLCGTAADFYLSTDGGLHWSWQTSGGQGKLPPSPGRCEGDFALTDNSIYVNVDRGNGEVWYSPDGGGSWTRQDSGYGYFGASSQGGYDNAIWVDPTNSSHIIVGGRNLQRSINGGLTLTKIGGDDIPFVHPDIHAIVPHPQYNGTTNKTLFIGCDGGIFATTDITTADTTRGWVGLNHNLGITQFYGGSAAPDGSLIAGGTQDNDRPHYTPAGGTDGWFYGISTDFPGGDATIAAIDFTNPSRVYMTSTSLWMGRSDDGGHTYHKKWNGLADTANALWAAPFVMDPNDANTLIAGGVGIWKTTDRAESWSQIGAPLLNSPMCSALDVAQGYPNVIWAGYMDGTILRSINGGASWDAASTGTMPASPVTDIAINPGQISDVMVMFGGYAKNRVWFTGNGGLNWESRSGNPPFDLPALQVNTVRFHPLNGNFVYVGTDLGVFASDDKGLEWNVLPAFAGNEGPANVEVDELFGREMIIAATYGRGMYRAHPSLGIFVDLNNPNPGDGTFGNPFQQLQNAINAQPPGAPLYIKSGTYQQGAVTFTKRGLVYVLNGPVIIK